MDGRVAKLFGQGARPGTTRRAWFGRLALGGIGAAGSALLAACGGDAPPAAPVAPTAAAKAAPTTAPAVAPTTAPAATPVPTKAATVAEIRLHGSTAGAEGEYWPKIVEKFNARGGKTKVTFEAWPPDQNNVPAAVTLGAAGSLGDVMRLVATSNFSQMAARGFLADLGPAVARDKADLSVFYPAATETLRFRGKQFGLPHIAHPGFCGLFINQDIWAQAGVEEPDEANWTFGQMQETLRKVQARRGEGQWALFPATLIQHLTVAARAFGGNIIDKDGKKAIIAAPEALAGVEILANLITRDRVSPAPGVLQGADQANFISGQVAAMWTNFGVINGLRKQAQGVRWKVVMGPKGTQGRGFFTGVDSASQNAASKAPDNAFEVVQYIVSKEVSLGWFDYGFAPGARMDTWTDPKVAADDAFKVFAKAFTEASPFFLPDNGLIVDYNGAINKELGPLWKGEMPVKDALENARRAGQEVLDRTAG